MKSIITYSGTQVREGYPCLKIFDSKLVVLFCGVGTGTVVATGKDGPWQPGYYSDEWGEKDFIHFDGSVELSND